MNEELFSQYPNVLAELFSTVKEKNLLHYALCFHPEVKGYLDPNWSALIEGCHMLEDRLVYLSNESTEETYQDKLYFALALYAHLATASPFYPVLKNFFNILQGGRFKMLPFADNQMVRLDDLKTQAETLRLSALNACLDSLVYQPLLAAYQTGDYLFSAKGISLHCSDPAQREVLSFEDFQMYLERLINFFVMMKRKIDAEIAVFSEACAVTGELTDSGSAARWQICYNTENKHFQVIKVAELSDKDQ